MLFRVSDENTTQVNLFSGVDGCSIAKGLLYMNFYICLSYNICLSCYGFHVHIYVTFAHPQSPACNSKVRTSRVIISREDYVFDSRQ